MAEFITEEHPRAAELSERLQAFYSKFDGYGAFAQANNIGYAWPIMDSAIREAARRRGRCRILEFGCGRSGFAGYLQARGLRGLVTLTFQDITNQNLDWLRAQGDETAIGPIAEVRGEFDLIFSTFVLEHLAHPKAVLKACWERLAAGGSLFLISPRYDFPFYLPPACDHLSPANRLRLAFSLLKRRCLTLATRRGAFAILDDPAVLHLEWSRDRDAIHMASLFDLKSHFRSHGAAVAVHRLKSRGVWWRWRDWKDIIVKRWLTLVFQARREG